MRTESSDSSDLDFGLADEVAVAAGEPIESGCSPDLGDLVVVLLAGTLAGLRERLESDGFEKASELVAELTTLCDRFLLSQNGAGPQ